MSKINQPIIAFQMDPFEKLFLQTDTSLMLAHEGIQRGFQIFHYLPQNLIYQSGQITAVGSFIDVASDGTLLAIGAKQQCDLSTVTAVLVRQNPPYDIAYISALDILIHLPPHVAVLNNPRTLRLWSEKTIPLLFPDLSPRTCITANKEAIYAFINQETRAILKPIYGYTGKDVFYLEKDAANVDAIVESMLDKYPYGVIVQQFLENVRHNEKRLIFINGELKSAFNLVPKVNSVRSNTLMGGTPQPCDFCDDDYLVAERLRDFLKENQIMLCGVDTIDAKLLEVNITSPAGLRLSQRLYGQNLAKDFWDAANLHNSND